MSCDYAVWHTASRLTNDEATRLYAALCDGDPSGVAPSPGIAAFYAEITALHPEIDAVQEDRLGDLDDCPWSCAFDRSDGHLIMCCAWSRAEYVDELVHRLARKHSLACYDPQTGRIAYPDVLVLRADGERKMRSPLLADLQALAGRMASGSGPSFAILEGRGHDYVQCAGEGAAFTVEWREYSGAAFRHWKAGTFVQETGDQVAIRAGDDQIRVEPNERLGAADVVAIMGAYQKGESRPEQYAWRDMTGMFPQ
jgi:hypothetical protein